MNCTNQNKYCILRILQEEFIKNIDDIFNKLTKAIEKIINDIIIQNIFICTYREYNHNLITNFKKKSLNYFLTLTFLLLTFFIITFLLLSFLTLIFLTLTFLTLTFLTLIFLTLTFLTLTFLTLCFLTLTFLIFIYLIILSI